MAHQVLAVSAFGLLEFLLFEAECAERMAHRHHPRARLVVRQVVFGGGAGRQLRVLRHLRGRRLECRLLGARRVGPTHGLAECLQRQGAAAEAAGIRARFAAAWAAADNPLDHGSCFCRGAVAAAHGACCEPSTAGTLGSR